MAREADPSKSCVMTIGNFEAGTAANIIPDTAILQGTIRTNDPDARELLVRRMKEVTVKTAEVYSGTAEIEMISEVAPLICDPQFTEEIVEYMKELEIPGLTPYPNISASASEDFASIAEKVHSCIFPQDIWMKEEKALLIIQRYSSMKMCARSAPPVWHIVQQDG